MVRESAQRHIFRLYDLSGREQSWDTLHAHAVLWHECKERQFRDRSLASAGSKGRTVRLTDAGRAYLAALREQAR